MSESRMISERVRSVLKTPVGKKSMAMCAHSDPFPEATRVVILAGSLIRQVT